MSDANIRAIRTAIQGLVAAVLITVVPLVSSAIGNAGDVTKVDWAATGTAVLTAALMAGLAYAQRTWLD